MKTEFEKKIIKEMLTTLGYLITEKNLDEKIELIEYIETLVCSLASIVKK